MSKCGVKLECEECVEELVSTQPCDIIPTLSCLPATTNYACMTCMLAPPAPQHTCTTPMNMLSSPTPARWVTVSRMGKVQRSLRIAMNSVVASRTFFLPGGGGKVRPAACQRTSII